MTTLPGYDAWLTHNPADDYTMCPQCEEGVVEGDRYEWWCSEGCGYGGDNIPEPDDYYWD